MADASFVQEGASIDYTPGSAVAAGDVVVQGTLVGVAKTPIAANVLGALAIEGTFDFVQSTGVIAVGVDIYWTGTVATIVSTSNTLIGKSVIAAVSGDTIVRVKMNQ